MRREDEDRFYERGNDDVNGAMNSHHAKSYSNDRI